MNPMRTTPALLVPFLLASSCTLFTSLDGLAGAPEDGGIDGALEASVEASTADSTADSRPDANGCAAEGLVAAWSFDEGRGAVVRDCSGNELDGVFTGTAASLGWGKRDGGGCLEIDGAGGRVTMGTPKALQLTDTFTVAAWYRNEAGTNGFLNVAGNLGAGGFEIALNNLGVLQLQVVFSNGAVRSVPFPALAASVWKHVTAVFERGVRIELYVDGVSVVRITPAQQLSELGLAPATTEFTVGVSSEAATWAGGIDDIRIYARALPDADIRALATK